MIKTYTKILLTMLATLAIGIAHGRDALSHTAETETNGVLKLIAYSESYFYITNTIEKFPQHQVQDPSPSCNGVTLAIYRCHMENVENPTSKDVTIQYCLVHKLIFVSDGEPIEICRTNIILSRIEHFELQKEWVKK